jgi:hypothetical protein
VVALLGLPLAGGAARAADAAETSEPSATVLRAQADQIAVRYFDALARYESLDRAIAENREIVGALAARAQKARDDARSRAIAAYRGAAARLPSIVASRDAIAAARRVRFIDQVNARDQAAYSLLRAATKELGARRRSLEAERREQADALDALRDQSATMEAKLALAQQREQAARAEQVAQVAALVDEEDRAPSTTTATTAPPTTTTTAPPAKPTSPTPPPDYQGTPGIHPMHDDPFLSCVRARESGGNYSAVNPAGPYLGAYQFLQATWNATANHAGRTGLVGVPANLATAYDQDDLAWALYQWQGAGPWGGSCP